jgi:hypothetical protein
VYVCVRERHLEFVFFWHPFACCSTFELWMVLGIVEQRDSEIGRQES